MVVTTKHVRFAIHDVTFGGDRVCQARRSTAGTTARGKSRWSARIVTRVGPAIDEGELTGRMADGRSLSGYAVVANRQVGAGGRRETLVELHGSGALNGLVRRAVAGGRLLVPTDGPASTFQVRDPQPGYHLALPDHRETAPPVELPCRPVVAAGRDQGVAAREVSVERVQKSRCDATPERARSDDEAVDVDRAVVERPSTTRRR